MPRQTAIRRTLAILAGVASALAICAVLAAPAGAAQVGNPGPFTVHVTGGSLQLGSFTNLPLPAGAEFGGQIDANGNITAPGWNIGNLPFDDTIDVSGVGTVHVVGSASFTSTALTGTLDPASGAASLSGGMYAAVTLTATGTVLGLPVQFYSGTCSYGSVISPIPLALTTATPGTPYDTATGAVTLSSAFPSPSLSACNPAVDPLYAVLLDILNGSGRLTVSGTIDPILLAGGEPTGEQTVTADIGAPVLTVSVPSSISFPTLYPGQTSSPVSAPVTVTSNNGFGYQLSVTRTAFSGGDIPLSITSTTPDDPGMVLDLAGTTPIPVAITATDLVLIGHRLNSITPSGGDLWPTSLILGPVPNVPPGQHSATLTYTVVGF